MSKETAQSSPSIRIVLIGVLANISLAIIKLVAGLLGHSYALVADAVESIADIFGSAIVWGGLQIAARPPDETHPYGHGKAEALASFIVACMLLIAGLGIAVAAVREIIVPHHAPAAFTLWVLIAVVAVKETLFQIGRRASKRSGSTAIHTDAWHHRADAITSLAAAIGISVALIGGKGYEPADDIAALFASGIIVFNAVKLLLPPLHELMDAEPTELIANVRRIASAVEGVRDIETLQARKSGSRFWVDMHIEVDPQMSVIAAHEISHRVKDAVRAGISQVADVLIHIEPHDPS